MIKEDTFICLDCETTGLDIENDKIIEIAVVKFNFKKIISTFNTLINPKKTIPLETQKIHNITDEMVQNKPTIEKVLPNIFQFIDNHIIVGHGIEFDINIIAKEAERKNIKCNIKNNSFIDTLRLARLYGKCSINSLESLRKHFNVEDFKAHRALNDVKVNIEIFKKLSSSFKTTESILKRLEKPIYMNIMPLGRYKGEKLSEIPLTYLKWASHKDFDEDLLFSIKSEIKNREKETFQSASNPFSDL